MRSVASRRACVRCDAFLGTFCLKVFGFSETFATSFLLLMFFVFEIGPHAAHNGLRLDVWKRILLNLLVLLSLSPGTRTTGVGHHTLSNVCPLLSSCVTLKIIDIDLLTEEWERTRTVVLQFCPSHFIAGHVLLLKHNDAWLQPVNILNCIYICWCHDNLESVVSCKINSRAFRFTNICQNNEESRQLLQVMTYLLVGLFTFWGEVMPCSPGWWSWCVWARLSSALGNHSALCAHGAHNTCRQTLTHRIKIS